MARTRRAKHLPHLSDYLNRKARLHASSDPAGVGCLLSLAVNAVLFIGLLEVLGPIRALMGTLCIGLPAVMWLAVQAVRWFQQPKNASQRRALEIALIQSEMLQHQRRGRLHKKLDSTAAALLEVSAANWSRIVESLDGPFWTSASLPEHWKAVRSRSLAAAEQAMLDLFLVLRPSLYATQESRSSLESVLESIADAFGEGEDMAMPDRLPASFEPARQIADKLKLLASEVESASREVSEDHAVAAEIGSAQALEACLSELRSIRQAESELREHMQEGSAG